MNTFGTIKSKLLKKLTESYISKNKTEIKEILNIVKSNKEFRDLYLFYEEIENKYINDADVAKLYVEELGNMLKNKKVLVEDTCKLLDSKLNDIIIEENKIYDALDQLLDIDSLKNIEKKVVAKKKIIEVVTTEKKKEVTESIGYTKNETLLHTIMANNFNSYYEEVLSEEEQTELKSILSMPKEELEEKVKTIKEGILSKIDNLINESSDDMLKVKLSDVKKQVYDEGSTKYSYYKLKNLLTDIQ
jgi:hypothetical protein